MKFFLLTSVIIAFIFLSVHNQASVQSDDLIVAPGQMPNIVTDKSYNVHMVYGKSDSIMYTYSRDQGKTFSAPALLSVLPHLAASHTRGPQLAVTKDGLVVTACTNEGDIFSYIMNNNGRWKQTGKVNDADTVAKENLMALTADGNNAFAVWLDLRDKHNKIYGARSMDGGKTWSKNSLV
ncbi:MAG TPA: sialidase family protein, partial [Chitinophagaceae bacterium]|nr:sialidase family protein [Chitinophagaceae bacterium]